MGYIRIQTSLKGPILVNADKILTVGLADAGGFIDFVLGFTSTGDRIELRFLSDNNTLNQQTLAQYNNAVIAAQNTAIVDITPLPGQKMRTIAFNPA